MIKRIPRSEPSDLEMFDLYLLSYEAQNVKTVGVHGDIEKIKYVICDFYSNITLITYTTKHTFSRIF